MNDVPTIEVVYYLYKMLGYNLIAKAIKRNRLDLDIYIKLLKFKAKSYPHLEEFINYFL